MSLSNYFGRIALTVAVLAWGAFASRAADVPAPAAPVVIGAAPVGVGAAGFANCETCTHGAARTKCNTCGTWNGGVISRYRKTPYAITLAPGACFGYFQTQWSKWDDVCPLPYGGHATTAVPLAPGGLTPPRPLDPTKPDPKMPEPRNPQARKVGGTPPGGYSSYHLPATSPVPSKFGP